MLNLSVKNNYLQKMPDNSKNSNGRSLENDVICYIKCNMARAPVNIVIDKCEGLYAEQKIVEAKASLLLNYGLDLAKIDPNIIKTVETDRKASQHRTRSTAVLKDIVNILNVFNGTKWDFTTCQPRASES